MPKRLNTDPQRTAHSKLPASLFTTEALPAQERFAAWRESIGVMLDTRVADVESPAFSARVESYLLDDILLGRSTFSAQKFDRTAMRIARDSIDHYMIQFFLSGHVEMEQGRRSFRMNSGGLSAFDLTEVLDSYDSACDFLCLVIPRRRLAPLLTAPDAQQGARVDPESGAGRLLANYLVTLYAVAATLTQAEGSQAARTLIDLTAMAFNGATLEVGDLPSVAQKAELLRVQNLIKERLGNFDLDPDIVAEAAAMSRAQLYRLFAPVGGIAEYIREQRLRRCLADLMSFHQVHRNIADIAYRWGFSDPTYFAKAFKQRFGRTPSEAREATAPHARQQRIDLGDLVGDRLYEEWVAGIA